MSRDLFGEFGEFQTSTSQQQPQRQQPPTSNNAFPPSQNLDDLLGLFSSNNSNITTSTNNITTAPNTIAFGGINSNTSTTRFSGISSNVSTTTFSGNQGFSLSASRPPLTSTTSEAIVSGQIFDINTNHNHSHNHNDNNETSTVFFSSSPHHKAQLDEDFDDDDFGEFAEEPLPSSNPSFGPLSNSSPTVQKPSTNNVDINIKSGVVDNDDEEFGTFIYTPRIPTPPPTFSLSSTLSNPNHLHPTSPPPPLHALLPLLTTNLLSPLPFLTRLKPLSYPAKQRLLSNNPKAKSFFTSVILQSHVAGRLIAGKRVRRGRPYKNKPSLSTNTKQEALKDDREIGECVREYNEIVGSLRAVVRGMGLAVVELAADMPVTAVAATVPVNNNGSGKGRKKQSTTATQISAEFCWLCGLSPTDRVAKLREDEMVVGTDGERWVSGWGHRGCRNWWEGCGIKNISH